MLSLDLLRQYPDIVREGLQRRQLSYDLEEILRLAEQRDGLSERCEGLYLALKPLREKLAQAPVQQQLELSRKVRAISNDIRQLELQIADIDTRLRLLLLRLPNLPHRDLPTGSSNAANKLLRRWGSVLLFPFQPRSCRELGHALGVLDLEAGIRQAGSHFAVFKGAGARLLRALSTFALDVLTREYGYQEVFAPSLVKHSSLLAAGLFPPLEEQTYSCQSDELYLNPGAETTLVSLYSETTFPEQALPLRAVTWSSTFRRDSSSLLPDSIGLLPLHQVNEIQLWQLVTPASSYNALQVVVGQVETLLQRLELAYRVVLLCAGRLPFASAMTISLDVWLPAQRRYLPVAAAHNYETFQTRRAAVLYRPAGAYRPDYPHSLGACALAIERTLMAILEVYQQADGSVVVPKVLRPYMGLALIAP
jgi:seryl-tRNA synthetase